MFAMRAASETNVDSLVAWAPILKGRHYVREMQALEMTALTQGEPNKTSGDIEGAGFVLSEQAAREISALDAFAIRPRCRRALIVARNDLTDDRKLLEHFAALGIDARQIRAAGYFEMMQTLAAVCCRRKRDTTGCSSASRP